MMPMSIRIAPLAALALAGCATGSPGSPAGFPTSPPAPLSVSPLDFPDFRESTLPNGLRLIVAEHPTQPLANVTMYVMGGASADPVDRAGLAGITADLLTKGTESRSATEIAEAIERVGGTLEASAAADWIVLTANVLSEHLPLAIEMVAESAMRPTFPAEEVELTRRLTLSSLQAALGNAGQIAQRLFDREIYGEVHAYGVHPVPASVAAATRTDVERFHDRLFVASNALLVVTGDVEPAEVERLARAEFGGWDSGSATTPDLPMVREQQQTEIRLVHRPASAQTNIVIGNLGFRPDDPDYYPLVVLNGVVGATPDARLFRVLREEKGWTYGSYSRFTRPRDIGYYMASAEVRPEVTDSTVAEMLAQLRRVRDESVPLEELEATKGFLAGSFPLRIETAAQVGTQIATTRLLGLPIEHMIEYRERIRAVTAADVQRVAREYLRPGQAVVVVVGDANDLLSRLEAIAPVRLFDVEGNRLDPSALSSQ